MSKPDIENIRSGHLQFSRIRDFLCTMDGKVYEATLQVTLTYLNGHPRFTFAGDVHELRMFARSLDGQMNIKPRPDAPSLGIVTQVEIKRVAGTGYYGAEHVKFSRPLGTLLPVAYTCLVSSRGTPLSEACPIPR